MKKGSDSKKVQPLLFLTYTLYGIVSLKAVLSAYELPMHQNSFFCAYRQSKNRFPHLPNHKLPTVSKYLGFNLDSHHNALADAEACAHIAMQVF